MVSNMIYISPETIKKRQYWIGEIAKISGNFGADSLKLEKEIIEELRLEGVDALLAHIRTCGALPEDYNHDSSEEKLYSKYTDILLAASFAHLGLQSLVVRERADAADVEAVGADFSFVADAKAFRLSRTAKNQKDFKVDAMHGWRRAHRYAVVVCPLYQLPARNSQIYMQATSRDVLILSYSHLAVLIRAAEAVGKSKSIDLLHTVFKTVTEINPSKDAIAFWSAINRQFINFDNSIAQIYKEERVALSESIQVAREEGLQFLSTERKRIMGLSHQEALRQLVVAHNIDSRMNVIRGVADNALFRAL